MPALVRLYIRNVAIGFLLSAVFVGALLCFDVAHLWHLISTSPQGWIAALMLFVFNGIVFAGVQFGIAVMRMAEPGGGGGGGTGRRVGSRPVAVPVAARADHPSRR